MTQKTRSCLPPLYLYFSADTMRKIILPNIHISNLAQFLDIPPVNTVDFLNTWHNL